MQYLNSYRGNPLVPLKVFVTLLLKGNIIFWEGYTRLPGYSQAHPPMPIIPANLNETWWSTPIQEMSILMLSILNILLSLRKNPYTSYVFQRLLLNNKIIFWSSVEFKLFHGVRTQKTDIYPTFITWHNSTTTFVSDLESPQVLLPQW